MSSRGRKITRDSIEKLVEHVPLAQHIGLFVEVKRSGSHHSSKCPFHEDSSPSFYIYDRHYHCFGCKAHGNVIDFEMHRQSIPFPEAVEVLADKYRFTLAYDESGKPEDNTAYEERKRLFQTMEEVSKAFEENLYTHAGTDARNYLKTRDFDKQKAQEWEVGLAPGHNFLVNQIEKKNWIPEDLLELGLIKKRADGSYHDFFFNRIMFPIRDERGQLVAFGGRIFQKYSADKTPPKYLNSNENKLFSKSRVLFNLHKARASIVQEKKLIVVEGYMDCIALFNAGVHNVVAVLGTALTPDHVKKSARLAEDMVLCFDSDKAGQDASIKSFQVAFPLNLVVLRSASVTQAKDPDEYVKKFGAPAFKKIINEARPLVLMATRFLTSATTQKESKIRLVKKVIVPVIEKNPDLAQQEVALKAIADELKLSSHHVLMGIHNDQAQEGASAPANKDSTEKDTSAGSLQWRVKSIEEFKFITALLVAKLADLPERLQNVMMSHAGDGMDEVICAKTLTEYLSPKSRNLFETISEFLLLDTGYCISGDLHKLNKSDKELLALSALVAQDPETLSSLGLNAWSAALETRPQVQFDEQNVFKSVNQGILIWWFHDLDISARSGTINVLLRGLLLKLELAYLDEEVERTGQELEYHKSNGDAAVVESLDRRRKRVSLERMRRGIELR